MKEKEMSNHSNTRDVAPWEIEFERPLESGPKRMVFWSSFLRRLARGAKKRGETNRRSFYRRFEAPYLDKAGTAARRESIS